MEPSKSRAATKIKRAFEKPHRLFVQRGFKPKYHRLDNKASTLMKDFSKSQQIDFQLVAPGVHQSNAAERAIHTFKNHFIAGLCTTDPAFWDKRLEQAQHSLNLLQTSRLHPQLSEYAHIWGNFDFNRTPTAWDESHCPGKAKQKRLVISSWTGGMVQDRINQKQFDSFDEFRNLECVL